MRIGWGERAIKKNEFKIKRKDAKVNNRINTLVNYMQHICEGKKKAKKTQSQREKNSEGDGKRTLRSL